jgi:hypothetical protein
MTTSECGRHQGIPWEAEAKSSGHQGAYVVRCLHVDSRFVVELRSTRSDFCAIDYVEEVANGVIVEAGYPNDWDELVSKMMSGEPPDPERS